MEGIEGYQEGHDGCRAQSHIPGGAQEDIHKASREGRVEAVLSGRDSSEPQEAQASPPLSLLSTDVWTKDLQVSTVYLHTLYTQAGPVTYPPLAAMVDLQ